METEQLTITREEEFAYIGDREASLVSGVNIFGFDNLTEVVEFLENRQVNEKKDFI